MLKRTLTLMKMLTNHKLLNAFGPRTHEILVYVLINADQLKVVLLVNSTELHLTTFQY